MMRLRHYLAALLLLWSSNPSAAQLRLPGYYGDHMILQRDKKVTIQGHGRPGQRVMLSFNQRSYHTVSATDSSWKIALPVMKAGGPYQIEISTDDERKQFRDVYFGDVWFCSGQSNMNFKMKSIKDHDAELADTDYPLIRQLDVPKEAAAKKQSDIAGSPWLCSGPATADLFSAVAFQFARQLYKQYRVPIGIIHSSWGGSPIETFMPAEALQEFPLAKEKIDALTPRFIPERRAMNREKIRRWEENFYRQSHYIAPGKQLDQRGDFFTGGWQPIAVPGFLEDQQIKPRKGMSWYRKYFELDKKALAESAVLDLGRINFASATFFNGKFVGQQLDPYYNAVCSIPASMMKAGMNEILVCAFNESEQSGFRPVSKPMLKTGQTTVDLTGTWQYKPGQTFADKGALGEVVTVDFEHSYPSLVYNAMIHPLFNYTIKGIAWYQGEANATMAAHGEYEAMLRNLISSWRGGWGDNKLPFLIVQLANYGQRTKNPVASPWALVQAAQYQVSATTPHTGIVVTNDVGNPIDVHPTDKQSVGKRLASVARRKVYGEKKHIASGPAFLSMKIRADEVTVYFKDTGSGLMLSNGITPNGFAVAGADGVFYRATARLSGNAVLIRSAQVKSPVSVSYAFESSPPPVNFYNKEGFPAVPFRMDATNKTSP